MGAQSDIERFEKELRNLEGKKSTFDSRLPGLRQDFEQAQKEYQEVQDELRELEKKIMDLTDKKHRAEDLLRREQQREESRK